MGSKPLPGKIGGFLLLCIATAMLLWGLAMPLVAILGDQAEGKFTSVRRQLGDRGESIPNRYTYLFSFTFTLPDGTRVEGHSQRLGDYFSPEGVSIGKRVDVRYCGFFPQISSIGWITAALIDAAVLNGLN